MIMVKKKQNLTQEELLDQALVPEHDWPYQVPKNWVWTKLRNIADLHNGDRGVNYPSKSDFVKDGIAFINAGALSNGKVDHEKLSFISEAKYNMLKAGKVKKNDVLYCLRGTLGKNALLNEDIKGAIASSLCIIRGISEVDYKYLFYLVNSEVIIMQQHLMNNGTAQPNLSAESVKNYMIPLAPLAEQHRIVERIESLFEKLDRAKGLIQDALDSFENRKAGILHKAFSGDLTENWREKNGINMEVWEEYTLGQLIKVSSGKGLTAKNMNIEGRIPVYGGNGITGFHDKGTVNTPTIVIGRVGYYCGSVHFINELAWVTDNALIVRFDENQINIRFLYWLLSHVDLRTNESSTAQPVISGSKIYSIVVKLPPYSEQQEIVKIIEEVIEKEEVANEYCDMVGNIELMKKTILARAFRSELGTNDSTDDSSRELLENIYMGIEGE